MKKILLLTVAIMALFTVNAFAATDSTSASLSIIATYYVDGPANVAFGTADADDLNTGYMDQTGSVLYKANTAFEYEPSWTDLSDGGSPANLVDLKISEDGTNFYDSGATQLQDSGAAGTGNTGVTKNYTYRAYVDWDTPIANYSTTVTYDISADEF
jgi:hypothetical protein